jgi:hypothetical protein
LGGHSLGRHADERFISLVWAGIGEDLDIDVGLAER